MTKTTFKIECASCGQPYDAIRKNTKYCKVCRLFNDAVYLRERPPLTCTVCEKEYAPLVTEKIPVCGDCNPHRWRDDASGTCVFCGTESDRLLHKDVKVCRTCAQDPDQRALFIKALGKKKTSRARG